MDFSLGFLFCSTDVYFCLCASTILSWWLWLCSRAWSQAGWFLQFHSFTRLLWLLEVFCISIQIVKLFVLALWKIPLVALEGLITCNKSGKHQRLFLKQCLPEQQNWENFKPRGHVYSQSDLSRCEFSLELGQRSTASKLWLTEVRRVYTIILYSTWAGVLVPAELKDILYVYPLKIN